MHAFYSSCFCVHFLWKISNIRIYLQQIRHCTAQFAETVSKFLLILYGATKVYHVPLMAAPNVEFCWNSTVSALLHDNRLTGLRLKDVNTSAERDLACDGVFISVGRAPATELFRSELALDKSGYIIADESTRTNLPGVFAVGDVRTKALRQVVTAVSDGAVAVHYAEEYLAENR